MNSTNVWNLVRVLRLTAISGEKVRGNNPPQNPSLHNHRRKSAILLDKNISYQTLLSTEELGTNPQCQKTSDIIRHKPGSNIADPSHSMAERPDSEVAPLMANAAVLEVPPDSGIPTEHEFEIYRLRRRVA